MTKKGQYLSFDVLIAAFIFIIALGMVMSYWQSMKSVVMNENKYLESTAEIIASSLISPSGVSKIGVLEDGTQRVDLAKLRSLSPTALQNYSSGYGVYVNFVPKIVVTKSGKTTSHALPSEIKIGNELNSNAPPEYVSKVSRILSYHNTAGNQYGIGQLNVYVYTNSTE